MQPGWEPPNTPALWGCVEEVYVGDYQQPQYGGGYDQPPPPPPQPDYDAQRRRWDEHEEQQVEIHHEERERHWYDISEERKHELEVTSCTIPTYLEHMI